MASKKQNTSSVGEQNDGRNKHSTAQHSTAQHLSDITASPTESVGPELEASLAGRTRATRLQEAGSASEQIRIMIVRRRNRRRTQRLRPRGGNATSSCGCTAANNTAMAALT